MSENIWAKLNDDFHSYIENTSNEKIGNQPPYLEQAVMLKILSQNQIIDSNDMLDYAGGLGILSKILSKYFNLKSSIFEPYMQDLTSSNLFYVKEIDLKQSKVVINSAMFEHITKREHLDHVNSLVSDDGVLILHHVVCENIPKNPNWFYILPPVHSALHTNKSMKLLMKQWGYVSSIYCPSSKCWVLFKKEPPNLLDKIKAINEEQQTNYLYYKEGFMDYWKGF